MQRRDKILQVLSEIDFSNQKHGEMLDPVEGLHTLKCEVAELEREIMRANKDFESYTTEMRQVAAMGLKLFFQCSDYEMFRLIEKRG